MTHLHQYKTRECTAADLIPTPNGRGIICCNCGASEQKFHNDQFDDPFDFNMGLDLLTRIILPGYTLNSFQNIIEKGELL